MSVQGSKIGQRLMAVGIATYGSESEFRRQDLQRYGDAKCELRMTNRQRIVETLRGNGPIGPLGAAASILGTAIGGYGLVKLAQAGVAYFPADASKGSIVTTMTASILAAFPILPAAISFVNRGSTCTAFGVAAGLATASFVACHAIGSALGLPTFVPNLVALVSAVPILSVTASVPTPGEQRSAMTHLSRTWNPTKQYYVTMDRVCGTTN